MLALVAAADPPHARLAEVSEPEPLPHQALVEVKAISLNRGETRRLSGLQPGTVTGWDLAGVVARAAEDGSGPPEGARVVGMMNAGGGCSARPWPATGSPSCRRTSPLSRRARCRWPV